ncbi:dual 3',5'-cyclic-AMP and -GMP phosphodiesterase 11A-like [Littorina saxatilis]|uniref:dual 3',5'-cyclic-AMP and -GMP phosphodiesterase 11A-like n=1 Tax=Littorina saxatilis TaxID=31220 RepID=UPI0038B5619E
MAHTASSVEQWLEANPDVMADLFLRKADVTLVNRWMTQHGLQTLPDCSPVTGRHVSVSADSSAPSSPSDTRFGDSGFFDSKHNRSNSKKYLRHDYARSKMKSMFRTYEPAPDGSAEQRRSSLKEMRQYRSLPPNSINMLSLLIQSKVRLPRYPSKDIDHKRELRHSNERDFFLEIVKDISNDLDLKSLSGKMVVNISCLADAERASLFIVEGKNSGKPSLVSKIFDVHAGTHILPSTTGDSRIPWGQGILGHVAKTGEVVNLKNVHEDPRFNDEIALMTGYQTESLLCHPIRNADDEIVGVAQLLNKTTGEEGFSKDDEKLLATYLTFCGIAIYNAQLFEAYTKEYERNRALLEVVHDLFEEQTSVESVVLKIMQRSQTLLKCERCSVLLKDSASETSFSRIFDLSYPIKNGHARSVGQSRRRRLCRQETANAAVYSSVTTNTNTNNNNNNSPDGKHDKLGNKIAELVLITGETINISDASQDPRFDTEIDKVSGYHTRAILCKPVRNRQFDIIGVAQVVNRVDGQPFDEHDDQLFEAFVIFCGLGISNCQLYEEVSLAAARQAVALEVLSYHTAASSDEVIRLKSQRVPETWEWRLAELNFNDFSLDKDQMMVAAARIFMDLGLMKKLRLDLETVYRWLLTVRRNYRNVAYHNWGHAFNVCQVMFATMMVRNVHLSNLEL